MVWYVSRYVHHPHVESNPVSWASNGYDPRRVLWVYFAGWNIYIPGTLRAVVVYVDVLYYAHHSLESTLLIVPRVRVTWHGGSLLDGKITVRRALQCIIIPFFRVAPESYGVSHVVDLWSMLCGTFPVGTLTFTREAYRSTYCRRV